MDLEDIIEKKPKWVSRQISDMDASYITKELIKTGATSALEIGSASGFSSAVIYGALQENDRKACRMRCFDLSRNCYYDSNHLTGDALWEIHGKKANVTYTTGVTSGDITPEMLEGAPPFDFLFIDANHRNPWAALDLLSLARFVKPDGLIGLDDVVMMYSSKFRDCNGARDLYRCWKTTKWRYRDAPNIGFLVRGSDEQVANSVLSCLNVDWDLFIEDFQLEKYFKIAEFYGDEIAEKIQVALRTKAGIQRKYYKSGAVR